MKRAAARTMNLNAVTGMPGRFRQRAMTLAIGALMAGHTNIFAAQPGAVLPAGTVPIPRAVFYGSRTVVNPVVSTPTGNLLVIDQKDQKAIIDWNSFNIARGSEVRFNQPGPSASALNRIYDADPSIIQGRLGTYSPDSQGNYVLPGGQLYLINQNGILFDRGSQVNVHTPARFDARSRPRTV